MFPARRTLGKSLKDLQIQHRFRPRKKGNGLLHVRHVQRDRIRKGLGEFLDGTHQRALEGGAPVLLQRLFSHNHREEFTLGHLHCGKLIYLFCVVKPVACPVPLDRQIEAIPHEIQITINGFGADFELARQPRRVGERISLKRLMDQEHASQRGAAPRQLGPRHGLVFDSFGRHFGGESPPLERLAQKRRCSGKLLEKLGQQLVVGLVLLQSCNQRLHRFDGVQIDHRPPQLAHGLNLVFREELLFFAGAALRDIQSGE
ncbi:hypothetical protein SDC9_161518 [bioreactor metagenome]|uniref:Uncharacterized protein n=1 Tax=bioreactor metagenome TaxID=1076179 RepID=A0A645FKV4_9ZZZZ